MCVWAASLLRQAMLTDPLTVDFNYGFSGNFGAGPYPRRLSDAPTVVVQGGAGLRSISAEQLA